MKTYLDFLWTNRATFLLLAIVLFVVGVISLNAMPRSIFPDVDFPRVTVLVSDGNLPVKYMLLESTEPLEQAAKSVPGVRLVKSQSGVGLSKLHIYFNQHVSPETAYLMLQARLAQIPLPHGAHMTVRLMTPHIKPFAQYALVSNQVSSAKMMPLYAFNIRPALLSVHGVYHVHGIGRGWPEVTVNLSARRLAEHHLNSADVVNALRHAQGPFYAGLIKAFHQQFVLVTQPRPINTKALAHLNLPIKAHRSQGVHTTSISLGSLGHVQISPPPLIVGSAVAGYEHALLINISAQAGANVVATANRIRAKIKTLRQHLPSTIHLVRIYDFSNLITHSLKDVWVALLLGSGIAWLVILLFLRRMDSALATLLVVPLAMAGTFLLLHMLGFGINIMTLGGLTAAIGALIDHAIVVMERGLHKLPVKSEYKSRRQAALETCREILPLMTMATLTSTIVFLPLIFLSGTLGLLFRHMALAIVIALLVSQLVALSLTPMLAAWLSQRQVTHRPPWRGARHIRFFYDRILRIGIKRPWLSLPVAIVLAAGGIAAGMGLPTAFLPQWDEGAIAVPFRTPVGTPADKTLATGRRLANIAAQHSVVAHVSVVTGRSLNNPRSTSNKGDLVIILHRTRHISTTALMQTLRKQFHNAVPNLIELKLHQIMNNRLENLSGSHSPLSVMLFGKNPATLHRYGKLLDKRINASHFFVNTVFKSPSAGPEITLKPRTQARLLGLNSNTIAQQIRTDEWGRKAGFLLHGEQILPIRVRVHDIAKTIPENLAQLPLNLPNGTLMPLSQIAHIHIKGKVPYVTHDNLVPYAYLWVAPKPGEGLAAAAKVLHRDIAATHLPSNITAVVGGYYRQQTKSFHQMDLILGGALLMLLIMLGFQFSGQRPAIAAIIAIAFAAPGAFIALRLTHTPLDSTAFLGLLLVFSIAVNNVILIFSLARSRMKSQPDPAAIARSARSRLRPIMMTMLADVLGFLPLAIGTGRGTDLLKPLAIAVMGGLSLALVATLWLAPVLYAGLLKLMPIDS